ncbi:MAG: autotransporter domain-containing protein, partial [Pontiella sp.]
WTSADAELGADSLLVITNGGVGTSSSAIIGFGNNSEVVVSGEDSLWTIENDLVVGLGGTGNSLSLEHGGLVEVGGTLSLANSQLSIDSGSAVMVDNYYQDASSTLTFDSVSTQGLITASSDAEFEAGASIAFTGSISNISIGVINSQLLVSSDELIVDGNSNVTSNNLDTINVEMSNNLFSYDLYADNNDLYVDFYRHALSSSAGFEPGTEMYEISGEIDGLSTNGSEAAVNQLIILGQMSAGVDGEQNAQLRQLYERNAPTFMHMEGLYEGMRQVKRNGVMPDSMWPVGAAGPHLYGDQVRGWVKGYGSWASQDGDGSYSSYDQDIFGVVVGFDKAFGDLLVGLAGGYTMSDISQDDGDQSESSTGFGMLYSSWGSSAWFLDGSLAFGMGSVENETGTQFDTSAEFDANQLAFYLGGGKELLYLDDRLIVTPSAGILGGLYMQEGYTEQADNAIARKVDDYNRFSFRSEFGVQAIFHKHLKKFVLMPETHVNWLHEFNDDEDQVDFSLVGGTGSYSFGMQAPVSDILEVGVGLSLWAESRNNVVYEWALGFDSRFGDGYSANAINARLVVEF